MTDSPFHTTPRRKKPTRDEREASCLLQIKMGDGSWLIPEPMRSEGTAKEIIAGVQYDHGYFVAWGGGNEPQNLTPRTPEGHSIKTNGQHGNSHGSDKHIIAKDKRIKKKQEEFRDKLAAKNDPQSTRQNKSRPLAGTVASGWKKPLNGPAHRR